MFTSALTIALVMTAMTRSIDGTLVRVEEPAPSRLVVRAEGQFQTFTISREALIERESSYPGKSATIARIPLADLTPGEFLRLQIDSEGRITDARAVAVLERAKVRSVNGSSVVLQDGTTLTIGSVLRFVDQKGKPSATPTVKPGEDVLLFRHPQTRNIYRFSAEPHLESRPESRGAGCYRNPPNSRKRNR